MEPNPTNPVRLQTSILSAAEKRLLVWIAGRLPAAVGSDHLTLLALAAMLLAGMSVRARLSASRRPGSRQRLPGGQLVRRQPRRDRGAGAARPAAAVRLLRGSRRGRDRHRRPLGGSGLLRIHEPGRGDAAAPGLHARHAGDLPRHLRARHVPDGVPEDRADGASYSHRHRQHVGALRPDRHAGRPLVAALRRGRRNRRRRPPGDVPGVGRPEHAGAVPCRAVASGAGRRAPGGERGDRGPRAARRLAA